MEMVEFLLSQGAKVNQVDSEGWTPLHVAASCGNLEITEYVMTEFNENVFRLSLSQGVLLCLPIS